MSSFSIFDDIIKSQFPVCKMHIRYVTQLLMSYQGVKLAKISISYYIYKLKYQPDSHPACYGREKVYARRVIKIADLQPMADPKYNTVRKKDVIINVPFLFCNSFF